MPLDTTEPDTTDAGPGAYDLADPAPEAASSESPARRPARVPASPLAGEPADPPWERDARSRAAWSAALGVGAVAVLAAAVVLWATRWGAGVTPDSIYYVAGARSILAGHGWAVPNTAGVYAPKTNWPAGYPALLAAVSRFGPDPLDAARYLGAALYAINVALVGLIVHRGVRGSAAAPVAAAAAFAVSPDLFAVHATAWSEPLFVLLALLALWAVAEDAHRPRWPWLVLAGLAAGATFFTRYAGLAVIGSGGLALLLFTTGGIAPRLLRSLVFGLIAGSIVLGVYARNKAVLTTPDDGDDAAASSNDGAIGRSIGLPEMPADEWSALWKERRQELADTASGWFVPDLLLEGRGSAPGESGLVWVLLGAAGAGAIAWSLYRARFAPVPPRQVADDWRRRPAVGQTFGLFAAGYVGLIALAIATANRGTHFDPRILCPTWAALIVAGAVTLAWLTALSPPPLRPAVRSLSATLAAALVLLGGYGTLSAAAATRVDGVGYASPDWAGSEIVKEVRRHVEPGRRVYTNGPDAMRLFADHPSKSLPRYSDPYTGDPLPDFDAKLARMTRTLEKTGGVIVLFDRIGWRKFMASEEQLLERLSLKRLVDARDGAIYRLRDLATDGPPEKPKRSR